MPVKVLDIDLCQASSDIPVNGPYRAAWVLIRWRGVPLGQVEVPVRDQRVSLASVQFAARAAFGNLLQSCVVEASLFGDPVASSTETALHSTCSVIVCTRDRPEDLKRCLDAILLCKPHPTEIIVVDNAPPND